MKSVLHVLLLGMLYFPSIHGKTVSSAASGAWSSPVVWQGGVVPGVSDTVVIASGHTVTIDTSYTVASITVKGNAVLQFDGYANDLRRLTSNSDLTIEATGKIIPSAPFATGNANARIDVMKSITVNGAIEFAVQGSTSGVRRIFYIILNTNGGTNGATAIQGSGTIETGYLQINRSAASDTITIKPGVQILTDYVYINKGTLNNSSNNVATYVATRFDNASRFTAQPKYRSASIGVAYLGSTDITAGVEVPDTIQGFTTQYPTKVVTLTKNLVVTGSMTLADGRVDCGKYQLKSLGFISNAGFAGKGYVTGSLVKPILTMSDSVKTFEVGSGNGYAEVNLKLSKLKPKGSIVVNTFSAFHKSMKDSTLALKRFWTFGIFDTVTFSTGEVTLRYAPEDFSGSTAEMKTEASLIVALYDKLKATWVYPVITQRDTSGAGGTITVQGVQELADMTIVLEAKALSVSSSTSNPSSFVLEQNYPNPFNPSTMIGFTLQNSGMTTLKIYDSIGREVATLVNEYLEAGVYHQRMFNASQLASGIYVAKLSSSERSQIRKLLLIK